MTTAQKIESTFHLGQKLPSGIVQICDFYDNIGIKNRHIISGYFELSSSNMASWFGEKSKAIDMLMPFGNSSTGGVYCIWLTDNLSPENAPIVMLGSEGETQVLAVNHVDFCKLLCLGYDEIGIDDCSIPPSELCPEEYKQTEPFRDYMQKIYHFDLPKTGDVIVDKAKEKFSDFEKWVEMQFAKIGK